MKTAHYLNCMNFNYFLSKSLDDYQISNSELQFETIKRYGEMTVPLGKRTGQTKTESCFSKNTAFLLLEDSFRKTNLSASSTRIWNDCFQLRMSLSISIRTCTESQELITYIDCYYWEPRSCKIRVFMEWQKRLRTYASRL